MTDGMTVRSTRGRMVGGILTVLRLGIAAGLLAHLGLSGAIDWSALGELWVDWPLTLVAGLLVIVDVVVTAWRLCVLVRPGGLRVSLQAAVQLGLIGMFFNACLPGSAGGDVIRMYYAAVGTPGRRTEVATILLLDRGFGLVAMALLPLLLAPLFPELIAGSTALQALLLGAGALAALTAGGLALALSGLTADSGAVAWALRRLPLGRRHVATMLDTVRAYRRSPGVILAALMISLLAHAIAVGVILLLVHITNAAGFQWAAALLVPLGFLANTLPLTPGGLGVGEAAFDRLFALVGITGGAASLLAWRLLTILVGLSGLVFYLRGRQRFVREAGPVSAG